MTVFQHGGIHLFLLDYQLHGEGHLLADRG